MHLRSRSFCPRTIAAGWLMIAAGALSGFAQQPSAPQPSTKQQPVSKQPSLMVDRDPVPSPDPEQPGKPQGGGPGGDGLGKLEREARKYTLRAEAYEVRLNATVLDAGSRSIQTLTQDAF